MADPTPPQATPTPDATTETQNATTGNAEQAAGKPAAATTPSTVPSNAPTPTATATPTPAVTAAPLPASVPVKQPSPPPPPKEFPENPEHFLLRIHCSSDLLGGWISLKGESSLLMIHLLNFLLLEHIIKKRHVNLIGLDHEEIRLERNQTFEKTGLLKEDERKEFQPLDEEMNMGDLWKLQMGNLKGNKMYSLQPDLPIIYLFLQSNDMFGEVLSTKHFMLTPAGTTPTTTTGSPQQGAMYLEATGKHALLITSTPTYSSVWSILLLDTFEVEEEDQGGGGKSLMQPQPIVYVRDTFHRFLSVVEEGHAPPPATAGADGARRNSLSNSQKQKSAALIKPPVKDGTLLQSQQHHNDTSKWVIEASNTNTTSVQGKTLPQGFHLRSFNLLGGTTQEPKYLYVGLGKGMVLGKQVNVPILTSNRAQAVKIDLMNPPILNELEKKSSGGSWLERLFLLSGKSFGYYPEEVNMFDPRSSTALQAAGAFKRAYDLSSTNTPYKEVLLGAGGETNDQRVVRIKRKDGNVKGELHLRCKTAADATVWANSLRDVLNHSPGMPDKGYTLFPPPPATWFAQARIQYELAQREAEREEEMEQKMQEDEAEMQQAAGAPTGSEDKSKSESKEQQEGTDEKKQLPPPAAAASTTTSAGRAPSPATLPPPASTTGARAPSPATTGAGLSPSPLPPLSGAPNTTASTVPAASKPPPHVRAPSLLFSPDLPTLPAPSTEPLPPVVETPLAQPRKDSRPSSPNTPIVQAMQELLKRPTSPTTKPVTVPAATTAEQKSSPPSQPLPSPAQTRIRKVSSASPSTRPASIPLASPGGGGSPASVASSPQATTAASREKARLRAMLLGPSAVSPQQQNTPSPSLNAATTTQASPALMGKVPSPALNNTQAPTTASSSSEGRQPNTPTLEPLPPPAIPTGNATLKEEEEEKRAVSPVDAHRTAAVDASDFKYGDSSENDSDDEDGANRRKFFSAGQSRQGLENSASPIAVPGEDDLNNSNISNKEGDNGGKSSNAALDDISAQMTLQGLVRALSPPNSPHADQRTLASASSPKQQQNKQALEQMLAKGPPPSSNGPAPQTSQSDKPPSRSPADKQAAEREALALAALASASLKKKGSGRRALSPKGNASTGGEPIGSPIASPKSNDGDAERANQVSPGPQQQQQQPRVVVSPPPAAVASSDSSTPMLDASHAQVASPFFPTVFKAVDKIGRRSATASPLPPVGNEELASSDEEEEESPPIFFTKKKSVMRETSVAVASGAPEKEETIKEEQPMAQPQPSDPVTAPVSAQEPEPEPIQEPVVKPLAVTIQEPTRQESGSFKEPAIKSPKQRQVSSALAPPTASSSVERTHTPRMHPVGTKVMSPVAAPAKAQSLSQPSAAPTSKGMSPMAVSSTADQPASSDASNTQSVKPAAPSTIPGAPQRLPPPKPTAAAPKIVPMQPSESPAKSATPVQEEQRQEEHTRVVSSLSKSTPNSSPIPQSDSPAKSSTPIQQSHERVVSPLPVSSAAPSAAVQTPAQPSQDAPAQRSYSPLPELPRLPSLPRVQSNGVSTPNVGSTVPVVRPSPVHAQSVGASSGAPPVAVVRPLSPSASQATPLQAAASSEHAPKAESVPPVAVIVPFSPVSPKSSAFQSPVPVVASTTPSASASVPTNSSPPPPRAKSPLADWSDAEGPSPQQPSKKSVSFDSQGASSGSGPAATAAAAGPSEKIITPSAAAFDPSYSLSTDGLSSPPKTVQPTVTKVEVVRTLVPVQGGGLALLTKVIPPTPPKPVFEEGKEASEGKNAAAVASASTQADPDDEPQPVLVVPPQVTPSKSTATASTSTENSPSQQLHGRTSHGHGYARSKLLPRTPIQLEPVWDFFDDAGSDEESEGYDPRQAYYNSHRGVVRFAPSSGSSDDSSGIANNMTTRSTSPLSFSGGASHQITPHAHVHGHSQMQKPPVFLKPSQRHGHSHSQGGQHKILVPSQFKQDEKWNRIKLKHGHSVGSTEEFPSGLLDASFGSTGGPLSLDPTNPNHSPFGPMNGVNGAYLDPHTAPPYHYPPTTPSAAAAKSAALDPSSSMSQLLALRRPLSMEELEARWSHEMLLSEDVAAAKRRLNGEPEPSPIGQASYSITSMGLPPPPVLDHSSMMFLLPPLPPLPGEEPPMLAGAFAKTPAPPPAGKSAGVPSISSTTSSSVSTGTSMPSFSYTPSVMPPAVSSPSQFNQPLFPPKSGASHFSASSNFLSGLSTTASPTTATTSSAAPTFSLLGGPNGFLNPSPNGLIVTNGLNGSLNHQHQLHSPSRSILQPDMTMWNSPVSSTSSTMQQQQPAYSFTSPISSTKVPAPLIMYSSGSPSMNMNGGGGGSVGSGGKSQSPFSPLSRPLGSPTSPSFGPLGMGSSLMSTSGEPIRRPPELNVATPLLSAQPSPSTDAFSPSAKALRLSYATATPKTPSDVSQKLDSQLEELAKKRAARKATQAALQAQLKI